ncbi:MAG: hypothetical protein LBI27_10180 [Clostridiales bacterium]|jgi:hypothetical protein|nr:hypothetical protein [Clostridiales bacterium]
MRKFGLLFVSLVVVLAMLSACNQDITSVDGAEEEEVMQLGSAIALRNAMGNFGEEFQERIATTPFQAFGMLIESLTNGTTAVDISYRDEWTSWDGTSYVTSFGGNFVLQSDLGNEEYALSMNINADGQTIDLMLYLNNERLAASSSLVGEVYGIDFATFREDLNRFGTTFQINTAELTAVADMIDEYVNMMNEYAATASVSIEDDPYARAATDYFRNNEFIPENIEITVGNETVMARRVAYNITVDGFAALMREWVVLFENDPMIAGLYDNEMFDEIYRQAYGMTYSDVMSDFEVAIDIIESELNGDAVVTFYIGPRDRLLRIEMTGTFTDNYAEKYELSMVVDLGGSATDTWRMDIAVSDIYETSTVSMVWDMRESGGQHMHSISMSVNENGNITNLGKLTSDWNPSTGIFVFSFADDWQTEEFLRGNFITSGGTFRLSFNFSESGNGQSSDLSVEISTSRGTNIPPVNYRNFADITMESVVQIMTGLGLY